MGSRGFMIHAYNNAEIDYGTMALCCASLIKKNLKINNTALVTSDDTMDWMLDTHGEDIIGASFDEIIIVDKDYNVQNRRFYDTRYSSKEQPYFNTNRVDSHFFTPFDETILIDADYLVLDQSLDTVWGVEENMLVNRKIQSLYHNMTPPGFDERFNEMGIPLYWATMVYFKKNEWCNSVFDLMKFIKSNYSYYKNLYGTSPSGFFRNDYALSMAIHMIDGHIEHDSMKSFPIPEILVATEFDDLIDFKNGTAFFISELNQGSFQLHNVKTNIHVMNKWSISRCSKKILEYAHG